MEFEKASINTTLSDYSEASIVTLAPSIQYDDSAETSPLLPGSVVVQNTTESGSTWYGSVFLVINAALGAGLLNFPLAYHQSGGLLVAITVQLVLAVFVIGSMMVLIYCAQKQHCSSYQDIVNSLCGHRASLACSVFIALYAFGTCITFFIIIGDQWELFLKAVYPDYIHKRFLDRKATITVTCCLIVLPMCFPKRIDFLKYASTVGVLAVVYCVILVAVRYFVGVPGALVGPIKTRPDAWTDVFLVVPTICFGYQCHLTLIPIYACTKKRTLKDFSKTILVALFVCFLAYTVTASLGYLTFGSCVQSDILLSYIEKPTPDVMVAVISIALKMYTTYPLLLFVGRAAVESVWCEIRHLSTDEIIFGEFRRRIFITIVWFITTLLLALFVPTINHVISVLGGLAAVFIFVFPGLCLLQLLLEGYLDVMYCIVRYAAVLCVAVFSVVLGAFIFGVVTTQSIWKDIYDETEAVCHSSV